MDLNTYLAELEYLVNIDSCSNDPEGIGLVAAFFADRFKEMGWRVETHSLAPHTGPCVICTNRAAEQYDLLMIGHLDTVFPKGTCAKRPFRMEGDMVYGPGVADMKQGCLLMYHLLRELPAEINEKLNIVAVFNPDEEIGSIYSAPTYLPYAAKSKYAYIYEGSGNGGYRLCAERKGATGLTVEFFGRAGHCGYVFQNGARSAVSEMAKWIVALDGLQSRERDTTVNVGVATGGTKTNVVADYACLQASIRYVLPEEQTRLDQLLERLTTEAAAREIVAKCTYKRSVAPLVPTEAGKAYIAHITELAKERGVELIFKARGGLSDANRIAPLGPICVDGLGPYGSKCHTDEEFLSVPSVENSFALSQMLLRDLAEHKK